MTACKRERPPSAEMEFGRTPVKFTRIKNEHDDGTDVVGATLSGGSGSQQDEDEVARTLDPGCCSVGGGDDLGLSSTALEKGALDVADWVPASAVALMRVLLDFKSTAPDPWYSLAKLPVQGCGWEVRSPTQSILTVDGIPARLFTVGPVTAKCFYTALGDPAARSRITIKLMRSQDRAAMGGMHERGRLQGQAGEFLPVDRLTAIAVHPHDEVFCKIFEATRSFRAREDLSTVHPLKLHVGDFVLVESIVVRTQLGARWKVSYHADGIFRLAERPEPVVKDSVVDHLHVPPVRFPLWL